MGKRLLLEKYIRKAVYKALKEQEQNARQQEKALYLVYRFPKLKSTMEDLMSPAFHRFVANIQLIAPKPTVFNIILTNGMDFTLTYTRDSFIAKIQGKKYNTINLGETERASQAISNMLELNYNPAEESVSNDEIQNAKDNELKQDIATGGGPGTFPGEENPEISPEPSLPNEENPEQVDNLEQPDEEEPELNI